MRSILIILIKLYQQAVSPFLGACCRYIPSCSMYAAEAIGEKGALKGGLEALRRVLRCHPFGGCGLDPVSPRHEK